MDFEQKGYYLKIDVTIKKIRNYYQKRFDEAQLNITVDQWVVLNNVCKNEGISQLELCAKAFKDAPTLTRIIDLMVKKEYLFRQNDREDRRKYGVFPTAQGKKVWEKASPLTVEARKIGWTNLSEEDYDRFYYILNTVFDNFSQ